jgi:cyclohexa-1,5-dienecarbonyl-CoA hydratase
MRVGESIRLIRHEEAGILEVVLDRPKGNILDAAMVGALRAALPEEAARGSVRALLFRGAGSHFSFGASVEEHRPDQVADMLHSFHGFFRDLLALRKPLLAAVQGQCLGGGLELAGFCQRVFAAPGAVLGQPEIILGVFAPVGSFVLPRRVGQAHADDLLLSGRSVDAGEALRMGLVDEVAEDPREAAMTWVRTHLLSKSAASLGIAVQGARFEYERAFLKHIDALEALYLDRLMKCRDAHEGIDAFLARRKPEWSHS